MRTPSGLQESSIPARNLPQKGVFAKIAECVRKVATILGVAAGVGLAANAPAKVAEYENVPNEPAFSLPASPSAPVPGTPPQAPVPEVRDRERKMAVEKRIAPHDFVSHAEAFLWMPYYYGGDGKKTVDCSQLVVETLRRAGIPRKTYGRTAADFAKISTWKKTKDVRKGDLVFLRSFSGSVWHVAIALGEPDAKGYIPILDASSSRGVVAKRKFHMHLAGLSVGSLPFIAGHHPVSDGVSAYAQASEVPSFKALEPVRIASSANEKPHEKPIAHVADVAKPAAVAKAPEAVRPRMPAAVEPRAVSVSQPKPVWPIAARSVEKPKLTLVPNAPARPAVTPVRSVPVVAVTRSAAQAPRIERASPELRRHSSAHPVATAETLSRQVEQRVGAVVIDFASRVADREQSKAIQASLEKRSLSEQISYYRDQAVAANDPVFSFEANLAATKLEIVLLHGKRALVTDNIAYYRERAGRSVPGAFETLSKLNQAAAALDNQIREKKSQMAKAGFPTRLAA